MEEALKLINRYIEDSKDVLKSYMEDNEEYSERFEDVEQFIDYINGWDTEGDDSILYESGFMDGLKLARRWIKENK